MEKSSSASVAANTPKVFIVTETGTQPVLLPDDPKKNFTVPEGYIVTFNRATGTTTLVPHASVNNPKLINTQQLQQLQQQPQTSLTGTSTAIDPINIIQNQRSQQKQMLKALQHQNQPIIIHHLPQNQRIQETTTNNTININPIQFVRMAPPPPPPPPPPISQLSTARSQQITVQNQPTTVQQVIYRNQLIPAQQVTALNQITQQVSVQNQQTSVQPILYRNQIVGQQMPAQQPNQTPAAVGNQVNQITTTPVSNNDLMTPKQMVLTQESAAQQIRNLLNQTGSPMTPVRTQSPTQIVHLTPRNIVQGGVRTSGQQTSPLQGSIRPSGQQTAPLSQANVRPSGQQTAQLQQGSIRPPGQQSTTIPLGNMRQSVQQTATPQQGSVRPTGQQTTGNMRPAGQQGTSIQLPGVRTPSPAPRNPTPQFRSQTPPSFVKNQAKPRPPQPNSNLVQLKFDQDIPQLVTPKTAQKNENAGSQQRVIRILHADAETTIKGDESPNSNKVDGESRTTGFVNSNISPFISMPRPRLQRPKMAMSPRLGIRQPTSAIACPSPRPPEGAGRSPVVVMVAGNTPTTENQDTMTVQQLLHGFGVDADGAHVDMQSFLGETGEITDGANSIVINAQEVGKPSTQRRQLVLPVTNLPGHSFVSFKTLPETLPEEPDEKLPAGYFAVCPSCGYSNTTRKCARCKRKIPSSTKIRAFAPNEVSLMNNAHDVITVVVKNKNDSRSESEEDKKKEKNGRKPRKKMEPVVEVLLSSDDEDGGGSYEKKNNSAQAPNLAEPSKEPVYTIEDVRKSKKFNEPLPEPPTEPTGTYSILGMSHARIGNFKSELRGRLTFSNDGVQFEALSAIDGEVLPIFIPKHSLKGVLVNYGAPKPLIFIYPSYATALRVRKELYVNDDSLFNYDPFSSVQAFRRMILTVERVTEENKSVLSTLLAGLITEISDAERDSLIALSQITPPPVCPNRSLLNFENLTITTLDYACLAKETYLNDIIIDFYLAFLNKMVFSPGDRARTHIFSSYFYNRLTKRLDLRECSKDSPAEKRHKRVRRWTKKTDLFEKDFIIIPINENSHWFLAIICFPSLTGPVGFSDHNPLPDDEGTPKTPIISPPKKAKPACALTVDANENGSERDEAEAEDDLSDYEESDSDESNSLANGTQFTQSEPEPPKSQPEVTPKNKRAPLTRQPIKQPCILIFDSLKGSNSRARVVATLRDFLKVEYRWKTGKDREFTKDNFKGALLKVPQQNNYYDCGLFVLQYVESFFKNPLTDYRFPIRYLANWFGENETRFKRKEIADMIKCLMLDKNGIDHRAICLPDLSIPANSMLNEDEIEDEEEEEDDEDEEYEPEGHEDHEEHEEHEDHEALVAEEEGEDIEEDESVYMDMEVTGDEEDGSDLENPGGSWIQNNIMQVKKFLNNRTTQGDGTTTQTLRSIRVNRPNQKITDDQPPPKRLKE